MYFTDGFENGFSPTCDQSCKTTEWTQEYFNAATGGWVNYAPANSQPWKTESDNLLHPDGAAVGKGRAYFRNEPDQNGNVQTAGYRTRLITPVMDLSQGYQPILRFYHAQAKYTGDFDTLRVYYRTGEGLQWLRLAEYTEPIQKWKFEEISLPAVGEYYQIAFEASENIGRGIVLDSVIVRTRPQITTPYAVTILDIRDNGATVQWQASKDADFFQVAVFDDAELDLNVNPELISQCAVDTTVESDVQSVRLDGLESGKNYYVQIRSLGETENSIWCDAQSFYIKPVVYLPYTETFNIRYVSNEADDCRLSSWYWLGDYKPIITMWIGEENYGLYSPDNTPAVSFVGKYSTSSGSYSSSSAIPAGGTSLLVSPEISDPAADFSLAQCHITFWGTNNTGTSGQQRSIIVGVMTDPEDLSTFVPIDTCSVWGYQVFEFFDIDLAAYSGNGRYVAFMSHFDGLNQFHIDHFTVEKRPAIGMVQKASMHVLPATTSATISWDAVPGATQYNVKYVQLATKGTKAPIYADNLTNPTETTVSTPSITLTDLSPKSQYAIAVQAIGGTWSQPKSFFTSAEMTVPTTYSFEREEGVFYLEGNTTTMYPDDWMLFSNDPETPYLYATTYAHTGKNAIGLRKEIGCEAYIVAPLVDDVTAVEVVFYSKAGSSNAGSRLQVGVMTDPTDPTTFVLVDEFMSQSTYKKNYTNFLNYTGTGKYIAVRWEEVGDGRTLSFNYIDDFTIRPLGTCTPAAGLIATEVTDSSAVLTWTAGDADAWNIKIHTTVIDDAEYDTKQADIANETNWASNTYTVKGLDFSRNYYVYIQAVCGGEPSEWSTNSFKTECPTVLTLPYKENFDYFEVPSTSGALPDCWTPSYRTTSTNYPCLTTSTAYVRSAPNALLLDANKTTACSFIAMPLVNVPLSEVAVSFYAKGYSVGNIVYIGVMTDPNDSYTFVKVDSATTTTEYAKYTIPLSGYTGTGEYIAFATFSGGVNSTGDVYVDDVEVYNITDRAPLNFTTKDATQNSLVAAWGGKTSAQWEVIVSKTDYPIEGFAPTTVPVEDRVAEGQVPTNEFTISEGLTPNTTYYFYVKSTAGTDWGKGELTTECERWNPREENQTEGFEGYGKEGKTVVSSLVASSANEKNYFKNALVPDCWTVGNSRYGTDLSCATTHTIRNYFPFIVTNGTTSSYAEKAAVGNQYAASGINSLKIYGYYNSTPANNCTPAWAAMPELDCTDEDLSQLIITGNAQIATTADYALIVGVMDDPHDISTFVVLDSIRGNGTGASGGNKAVAFEVSLEDYKGTGRYIAFRNSIATKSVTIYLDNVNVSLASCAAPKISVTQVTDVSARVYSGLRIDNAWTYYLSTTPFNTADMDAGNLPAEADVIEMKTIGDGSEPVPYAPLTNLQSETTYYIAVATVCDGKTSAWKTESFQTLCPDTEITAFVDGFSEYETGDGAEIGCWITGNMKEGANSTYQPTIVSTSYDGKVKKMMQLRSHATNGDGCYAITHGLKVPEGKKLQDYRIRCNVASTNSATKYQISKTQVYNLMIGVATDPSDMSTVVMLDTFEFTSAALNKCVVSLDRYTGNGKYIVLCNHTLGKQTASYAFVDSVWLEPNPTCGDVYGLEFTETATNSLTLQWQGNAAKYNVALSTVSYEDEMKADSLIESSAVLRQEVEGTSTTFTDLESNTRYYAYAQAICSETDKSEWTYDIVYAQTDCDEFLRIPFVDDFESYYEYGSGIQPTCYYTQCKAASANQYPYLHDSKGFSGEHSMYLFGNKGNQYYSLLATLPIDVTDPTTLQIAFAGLANSSSSEASLIVGLVEDLDSLSKMTNIDSLTYYTFYPLDTCTAALDNWTQFYLNLNESKYAAAPFATHKHIAFVCKTITGEQSSAYFYLDDLRIRPIPMVYEPENLEVANIGLYSADVSFTPANEADTKWELRWKNTLTNAVKTIELTSSETYMLTGLDHSTAYQLDVRTIGDDEISEWTNPVEFSTKYLIDTYTFTFSKDEQGTTSVRTPAATNDDNLIHPALTSASGATGTSVYNYYPYIIPNTANVTYSMDPSGNILSYALKFLTSVTNTAVRDSSTLILPIIKDPESKQISFYLRGGDAYTSTHNTVTTRNLLSTVSPDAVLTVGVVDSMQGIATFQPIMKFKPSQMGQHYGPTGLTIKDTLRAASRYGWDKIVVPLDKIDMVGKQVALMLAGCGSSTLYIDTLSIEKAEGFTTPHINSVVVADKSIDIEWTATGATAYNVYVVDSTKLTRRNGFIPYLQDAEPAAIRKIEGITATSCTINDLQPGIGYGIYVEDAAHAGNIAALSPRRLIAMATCEAISGNGYQYGFEPGPGYVNGGSPAQSTPDGFRFTFPTSETAADTAYKVPECWIVGSTYDASGIVGSKTYHPTIVLNTSNYRYSLEGSGALQLHATSDYQEIYAVMPLLDVDMDTAEVVFYGRCFYEKTSDATPYSLSYIKGTSYSQKIAVGTMSIPTDKSTFVPIDTIEYDFDAEDLLANTKANADTAGLRYFQKFAVPLHGAQGRFIAFRQVKYGNFFIDNITVQKRQTARAPRDLQVAELTNTTATLAWRPMEEEGNFVVQYMERMSTKDWSKAQTITDIAGLQYTLTDLTPNTEYVWRVCQIGTAYGSSAYAHYASFRTDCNLLNPNGYTTGFECTPEDPARIKWSNSSTEYKQNECWTYLNLGSSTPNSTSAPYNIPATASTSYAHSGTYSLKLYEYKTTYRGAVVSPRMDAEIGVEGAGFDTLQVSFWACPSPHGIGKSANAGKISSASARTASKLLEVGTCTDPNDTTTFTILQTCQYVCEDNTLPAKSVADETNDFAFQKFTVPLDKATGPYVFIRAQKNDTLEDGTVCTGTYTMYIDDLSFETLLSCDPVLEPTAESVTSTTATITWQPNGGNNFDIEVSTDYTFEDTTQIVFAQDTLTENRIVCTNLDPSTVYYYHIKNYCDESRTSASDWTSVGYFRTAHVPMFEENFTSDNITSRAKGWTTMAGYAQDIFAGGTLTNSTNAAHYNSWYRIQNNVMSGIAMRLTLYYAGSNNKPEDHQEEKDYHKYWLITPEIYIEHEDAQLVFDAVLSTYEYNTNSKGRPIREDENWDTGWDDQFMVIVSDDGGATWKRENATIWNNEKTDNPADPHYRYGIGDYSLVDMSYEPEKIRVDLSKYQGKQIKIAFYGENTYQNANCAVHIDNVHVNYLATQTESISLCQFEDVDNVLGFSIDGDTASAGAKTYERLVLSVDNDVKDSLFILDTEYKEAPVYNYEISVCEGTPFEYMGFNEHSAPGTYRMKLTSAVTGCDSIVNFTIRHTPQFDIVLDTTICEGSSVYFDGRTLTEAGTYTAYLKASEKFGGCDSIVTLRLALTALKRSYATAEICEGESYTFGGKTYTASGVYHDTIRTDACDSVATLSLVVHPTQYTVFRDSILHGESYFWAGQTWTESVIVDSLMQTTNGCDSIVTLNLLVKYADVVYQYEDICEGSTFTFGGKVYDKTGTYYDTVRVEGQPDVVRGLLLTVHKPDAVTLVQTICAGDSYLFDGQTLTESGSYTAYFTNRFGCDSTVNLTLNVLESSLKTEAANICQGDEFVFGNRVLTESGIYYDTLRYVSGCDSIITELHLTVAETTYADLNLSICSGGDYLFGDTILTTAGVYTRTITNRAGCDSIITLRLSIDEPLRGTKFASFSTGCSYTYNGITYDQPGEYEIDVLKTEAGCDSIITLVLTETEQGRDTVWATVCPGDYYIDEDFNTNTPGTHEVEIPLETGCSIIRTLILTNVDNNRAEQAAICPGDTYDFYGQTLTDAGVYTTTLPGQGEECDTLVTLTLSVLQSDTLFVKDSITVDQLPYYYQDKLILDVNAEVGVHHDTLTIESQSGACRQVVVLEIEVTLGDALEEVAYASLTLNPTLVRCGETVVVENEFSAAERASMQITLFDMVNHRILIDVPESGPITINDIPCVAGVYIVRITTQNQTYIGRIVVKN